MGIRYLASTKKDMVFLPFIFPLVFNQCVLCFTCGYHDTCYRPTLQLMLIKEM